MNQTLNVTYFVTSKPRRLMAITQLYTFVSRLGSMLSNRGASSFRTK
jgi:hypothetical protein